mmetsp:Transcript_23764/g.65343  ORF Transcript_23764/g.65343 Transcript_23764/m.65343 type:complete len:328 (-) Transcript_23764:258-1241(-)|eukprot:CAMPEP_0202360634 /NCGR_PEP_ID=MMETSP1126-20121109/13507_1 /ASSEMBLY_ACC=CAM_ASM_000457 /TAXON_ID=3047 /ORGANISM="Dunaliella tertiolecta, Strain CCMP1320" /LENGTH=327 /DNA_ID=CAMNT_0048954403 /DNA_START=183 /DNA_END=1166 /DNA_ORIENTATION=-
MTLLAPAAQALRLLVRPVPHGAPAAVAAAIAQQCRWFHATSVTGRAAEGAQTLPSTPGPSAGSTGELHVSVEPLAGPLEGVSVLSLTRAHARNAIGRQLLRELIEVLDVLRQERSTSCVVIRSTVPGVFSSGADLKERATMTHTETLEFVGTLRRTFGQIQALPMPTIAAIDGLALGGGAELALSTDIRIAGQGASLAFPEAKLGIIPGAGGTQRLPRLIGASRAKELCFTGRRVSAETAAQIGLVDHVVSEGRAYEKALELAKDIIKSAPLSLRMAKAAINHGMDTDSNTGMLLEDAYYSKLIHTKDRAEGLRAFSEDRQPQYVGE